MSVAKRIPDEPSQQVVDRAFSVLCRLETFQIFRDKLPPDLRKYDDTQVDTSRWKAKELKHGQIGGRDDFRLISLWSMPTTNFHPYYTLAIVLYDKRQ